jgi:RimJ/RimL family protein N-acetyltransferase
MRRSGYNRAPIMQMDIQPIILTGRHVRLEPLTAAHAEPLWPHADEPAIWQFMPYGEVNSVKRLGDVIADLLRRQHAGTDLCFAVVDRASSMPVGMTRYMTIERAHRGLEIGGTWYGMSFRRTAVNTECKYLLMQHAFESLGCIRVQLKTDLRNERSQRAIERLGATREGVLRKNIIMPDGYQRSSVMYSVIDDAWPAVKLRLQSLLNS